LSIHSSHRKWYAVQTRSNFEKVVCAELENKGVENYCPMLREVHQWADRQKAVELPLFPGYVFTRFQDSGRTRRLVLHTAGAVKILGNRDTIEPVADSEIESLQKLLKTRGACSTHPFLREGARVRVKRGSLQGVEGILVRVKNETRLVLTVTLFCKSVSTEINARDVEMVGSPAPRRV
jgi:transcription termination/antitermination protein NusG